MNNKVFFVMAINFLMAIKDRLSTQLQSDFQKSNVALQDQILEIKKEIQGGQTIDLLDATDDRIDGINSFDKNRLKTGRAFVFDEVSLGYATNAASGLEGSIDYVTAAPKELKNAIFIAEQEGREGRHYHLQNCSPRSRFGQGTPRRANSRQCAVKGPFRIPLG